MHTVLLCQSPSADVWCNLPSVKHIYHPTYLPTLHPTNQPTTSTIHLPTRQFTYQPALYNHLPINQPTAHLLARIQCFPCLQFRTEPTGAQLQPTYHRDYLLLICMHTILFPHPSADGATYLVLNISIIQPTYHPNISTIHLPTSSLQSNLLTTNQPTAHLLARIQCFPCLQFRTGPTGAQLLIF